jgi:hypothetical protein
MKCACIWICYVRDGCPISRCGLHYFSAYCSQLEEDFNMAPETSIDDVLYGLCCFTKWEGEVLLYDLYGHHLS